MTLRLLSLDRLASLLVLLGARLKSRVAQRRVQAGPPAGEFVPIVSGLSRSERVVVTGAGFLSDGDQVRVAAP